MRDLVTLLLLAAATGCAGTGVSTDGPPPRELTPVSKMPMEDQATLLAYAVGGEEWDRLRLEIQADPGRARWMCENLVLELFRAYDGADLAGMGETRGPFERARDELIFFDVHAVPVLVELLPAKDGVVPVVASDILASIGRPAVLPVAELIEHDAWRTRRYAIELLGQLPYSGPDEDALQRRLAEAAKSDPEWIVRAQAARTLGLRGGRHTTTDTACAGIVPVLMDDDPAVARVGAEALTELADPACVPALLNYLERAERAADARGQQAARAALQALTGAEPQGQARAWRVWWSDHRGELLQGTPDRPY